MRELKKHFLTKQHYPFDNQIDLRNWKEKVSYILEGHTFTHSNSLAEKIINKCRFKYDGSSSKRFKTPNDITTIKYYNINNNTFKVINGLSIDTNGYLGKPSYKSIQKMGVFNSFDYVPKEYIIDYRRCNEDGTKVVAWKYIKTSF